MHGLVVETSSALNIDHRGRAKSSIIDAHIRNSLEIREAFDFDFASNDKTLKRAINQKYDIVLVNYSSSYAARL